jgi:hypothetical protein
VTAMLTTNEERDTGCVRLVYRRSSSGCNRLILGQPCRVLLIQAHLFEAFLQARQHIARPMTGEAGLFHGGASFGWIGRSDGMERLPAPSVCCSS